MYVGVILFDAVDKAHVASIPHVCGGDPRLSRSHSKIRKVFPMYVGVILLFFPNHKLGTGIPHVCGGDPISISWQLKNTGYSPCMWG